MALGRNGSDHGAKEGRPGRPAKDPDPLLGSEITAWAGWLGELVDQTWPTRREATRALRVREDELSRMLSGRRMPRREWLDNVFEALRARTGQTADTLAREQARALYMDALKTFEELEKQQPGKRQTKRPSWQEYTLRDSVQEASHREQRIRDDLEKARGQQQTLTKELQDLHGRWKRARAELERAEQDIRAQAVRCEEDGRQLAAAARLVRELEEQIEAREQQRTTMLERIREQQHQLAQLRAGRDALGKELTELKGSYAYRHEVERRLKEEFDIKGHAKGLFNMAAGMWAAAWLLDGFTIQGDLKQQAATVVTCVVVSYVCGMGVNLLIMPLYAAVAIPALRAADRNDQVRAERNVAVATAVIIAVGWVSAPYGMWLSVNVLGAEWLGLPVSLQGGLTTMLAFVVMVGAGILAELPLMALSFPIMYVGLLIHERRERQRRAEQDRVPKAVSRY
ncbi:hypothetical protein [Streptomyces sp. NPDC057199]|uniref:hypothetical protein n=1 Tax=Streptomyces sp. NPDC057199 TaxID=3346047 RepID=UPI00363121D4